MRRKRTPKSRDLFDRSHSDDLDLANAPDSDVSDFGDTATRGFSDAWDDADTVQSADSEAAVAGFSNDESDTKGRDLDTTSKKGAALLVLVVLIGGALGLAAQLGAFATAADDAEAQDEEEGPVLALDAVRVYEGEPTSIELVVSGSSTDLFRTVDGAAPLPDDRAALHLPPSVGAGPVLWAGRMHIALFGDDIGTRSEAGELCVVATLVTEQLAAIDVAGHGDCELVISTTGDRLACSGDDVVMLEVWSDDPGVPGEPPPVAALRYRVEGLGADESVMSRRGSFDMAAGTSPLVDSAAVLGGAPGDSVTISSVDGALSGSCILVDRTDVAVKLLPS